MRSLLRYNRFNDDPDVLLLDAAEDGNIGAWSYEIR